MPLDDQHEAELARCLRTLGDASTGFGKSWSSFAGAMAEDEHLPEIQDAYVEPMLRSQYELIEALDALRLAVRRFDQASEDARQDAERLRIAGKGR